jgi:hypothetical protein
MAHRVTSLRYNDLSVFGAKRPCVSPLRLDTDSAVSIQALRALGRNPLGASVIVRWAGADGFAQRTAAVQSPRIAAGDRAAAERRRRGKALPDAAAFPADLPADDLCRPAFGVGLKASVIWRPVANGPTETSAV